MSAAICSSNLPVAVEIEALRPGLTLGELLEG